MIWKVFAIAIPLIIAIIAILHERRAKPEEKSLYGISFKWLSIISLSIIAAFCSVVDIIFSKINDDANSQLMEELNFNLKVIQTEIADVKNQVKDNPKMMNLLEGINKMVDNTRKSIPQKPATPKGLKISIKD